MSGADLIAALDDALDDIGEDIVLRRVSGGFNIDVSLKAVVADFRPEELVGGITQNDSKVILSPSGILKAQWPGGVTPPANSLTPGAPAWIPRPNDKVIVNGRLRNVTFVNAIDAKGDIVRIELTVSG